MELLQNNLIYLIPAIGVIGILVMMFKSAWVIKQDPGDENMRTLAGYIADGAMAFLRAEWKVLSYFVVIAAILLAYSGTLIESSSWVIAISFIIGAFTSALAGYIGMNIATEANVRTTQAARTSLAKALKVSFTAGSVMGIGVVGLAILGLGSLFIVFYQMYVVNTQGAINGLEMQKALEVLAGFSLGAESIALFARVGGGIYTKAADVGADLVGKVEAGIPEDDVRNPATIADNVGDNVGDVAGMGADLFGSYVATMLAAMVLGNYVIRDTRFIDPSFTDKFGGMGPILLPIMIAGVGIIASIIGASLVKIKDNNAREPKVQSALNLGNWAAIGITAISVYFLIDWMLPEKLSMHFFGDDYYYIPKNYIFLSTLIGLAVGGLISMITEYYTGLGKKPVMNIIKNSSTGAATNIIAGLSVGMISTFLSVILFAAAIWVSYELAGFYGVAMAASAMMATTAMALAIDAFGPIADNAGGIAEMSELPKEVRERTDILDSVGNTTAAIGKGFAIASAALTALALFAAYVAFT